MRLMIIGDLSGQVGTASQIARERGAKVSLVPSVQAAIDALCNGHGADLLMIDVKQDVGALVHALKRERIHATIVGCGFNASSEEAARAIRAGAKEYIPLPPDAELIAAVLEAITEEHFTLIYASEAMNKLILMAKQIAPSDASVLITGESGTGKEVISRYLHQNSRRKDKPFISINCAAIPENLLESELFGHEKGAFTGALNRRIGKFEEANGGTLLLDEISEMDLRLQSKLLRAIQEREIDRVGGDKPVKVDIRILATSNRNLPESVEKGEFREDLYYRLNVIQLEMPSLRDRKEDIAPLADYFIQKYSESNGIPKRHLSDIALTMLLNHYWPGNVRELENTLHRAVLLARGDEIGAEAILLTEGRPSAARAAAMTHASTAPVTPAPHERMLSPSAPEKKTDTPSPATIPNELVGRTVADVERDLIISTLDHCLGNRTQAATILGISIRTLRNKLNQYADEGIEVPKG